MTDRNEAELLERFVESNPEDVAALVLFLASDAASHITGTNIPCDGGVMA